MSTAVYGPVQLMRAEPETMIFLLCALGAQVWFMLEPLNHIEKIMTIAKSFLLFAFAVAINPLVWWIRIGVIFCGAVPFAREKRLYGVIDFIVTLVFILAKVSYITKDGWP